jgi:hypothetical protein
LTIEEEISVPCEILPPPDGGYGWVCVAAQFTINCFTWGVVSVRSFVIESPRREHLAYSRQIVLWRLPRVLSRE